MKNQIRTLSHRTLLALVLGLSINTSFAKELKELRVGYIPIADCAQIFIAQEKGFFKKEGLRVKMTALSGGAQILEAVGTGSLDVGFSNVVSLILARNAGLRFVAIAGGPVEDEIHREHAILVAANSSIYKVSDLVGKRIAINNRKNIDELMVTTLLRKHGVEPSKVSVLEVPFPRMLSVLMGGDVEAVAAIEPFVTVGLAKHARVLSYNYTEIQPTTEISVYTASSDWVASHPAEAAAFGRAMAHATRYANENSDQVRKILSIYTKIDPSLLEKVVMPKFLEKPTLVALTGMIARVADMGWISAPFPAENLLPLK